MNPIFNVSSISSEVKALDFLSIEWSVVILTIINTFILFLIIKHFLFERVNKMLETRQNDISNSYAKADESMDNAKKLEIEYTTLISNAKEESAEIVKNAAKKAQAYSENLINQAKNDASSIIAHANDEIEREKKRTQNEMKKEISMIAVMIAEKIALKEIGVKENEQLIDELLENAGDFR